ncbi:MAG: hypothetical protein QW117_01725 [Candidatus Pacearchaeota archaeon]
MATKIQAAQIRLFKNVFICKNCSAKIRADPKKIIEKKVKCRRCGKKNFRQIRKK